MAEERKQRGLTPEQWVEVRAAYENGESIASLSKRFSIRRPTITARRDREAWTVQATVQMHGRTEQRAVRERTTAKVIDMASRRAVEKAVEDGTVDAIADELGAISKANRIAAEFMVDLLTKARNGQIAPAKNPGEQTAADVAKAVMSTYRTYVTTIREDAGRKSGQPTVAAEKTRQRRIIFVKAEPKTA